ncbi:MAG TPA: hypothetical protein VMZ29_09305 [Candidatus Bathyarchaeia archaeon]|nr:hypothetical protein [Candidatus Bathyarchaeia archaeon]
MKCKSELIGIIGFMVIIIPILSSNFEIRSRINHVEEQDSFVPKTVYTIIRQQHRYWDFGNLIKNTYTIDIDFTSNVGVDSWFMTYDDMLRWEADTPPYTKWNIQYDKISRTIDQWNPDFNDHWVFIIDNPNFVSASVDYTSYKHRTQVEITGSHFVYYDSDNDGYNDSLTLYFDVSLDRYLFMDFTYEVDFSYKGENSHDNIHEIIDDTTWINHERTIDVFLNPKNNIETAVTAAITVEINDGIYDNDFDYWYTSSSKIYYPKYRNEKITKISLSIGIPTITITTIVISAVLINKKRKLSLKP